MRCAIETIAKIVRIRTSAIVSILLFFALISFDCIAQVVVVNSNHAEYDGSQILLKGAVVVNHAAGILTADKVTMKPKLGKDGEFDSIDLNEHVVLRLADGGELICNQANLNLAQGIGTCFGKEREYVVFHEYCTGTSGEKTPVTMKSRKLTLIFEKEPGESTLKDQVRQIEADEDVTISYNHDFIASGNRAVFYRQEHEDHVSSSIDLPGQIVMTSLEGSSPCQVTNQRGDLVYAKSMKIDTSERQLQMENFRGTMNRETSATQPSAALAVCSDRALWDEREGIVTLLGNVEVNDPAMGLLKSKERILLFMEGQQSKHWVRAEADGESTLIYRGKEGTKTLKCYGICILDHVAFEARLTSPKDNEGIVIPDNQVFYTDERGQISADRALIQYKRDVAGVSPERIVLYGHVKIVNTYGANPSQKENQYVLADRVDFFPDTQVMELKGTKGRRILFYDDGNDIQLSAPALKIRRDRLTSREMVEGGGDVRFHLVDQEIEKLRQQFSLDRITGKKKKEEK